MQSYEGGGDGDERRKFCCNLLLTRGAATKLFETTEELLDKITLTVHRRLIRRGHKRLDRAGGAARAYTIIHSRALGIGDFLR